MAGREINCSCTCKVKGKHYFLQICVRRLENTKSEKFKPSKKLAVTVQDLAMSLTLGASLCMRN